MRTRQSAGWRRTTTSPAGKVASLYSYADVLIGLRSFQEHVNMSDLVGPVLWEACFDESGKLQLSDIVSFGGCAGPREAMTEFCGLWERCIKQAGLSYTSMKDAMRFEGPYSGWKDNILKRDQLLTDLAKLLLKSELVMISAPMATAEFKALPAQEQESLWNDVEYCGFEACTTGILEMAPNLALHVICDLSEQYAPTCVDLFNKLRTRNEHVKAQCFAITFADDKRHAGLQAADMIAYCSRADYLRSARTPDPIVQDLLDILSVRGNSTHWFVWKAGGKGIGHGQTERSMP
jgi:hypothetical protein